MAETFYYFKNNIHQSDLLFPTNSHLMNAIPNSLIWGTLFPMFLIETAKYLLSSLYKIIPLRIKSDVKPLYNYKKDIIINHFENSFYAEGKLIPFKVNRFLQ